MNSGRTLGRLFVSLLILSCITTMFYVYYAVYKKGFKSEALAISDFIVSIIGMFSALGGSIAAYFAYKSAGFVERATEGELYLKMMERYASEDMVKSLRIIGNLKEYSPKELETYINKWWEKRENGDAKALEIDSARHTIKYFYRDLMQLVQAKYFNRDLAKRITNTGGRYLFKYIILPMERRANQYFFEGEFDPFNEIFNELEKEQTQK